MTTDASGDALLVNISLRGNGAMSLWKDRLEVAGVSYPLSEIAWVGLVNDPAAPQGAQPLPAVAWRTANGQHATATPQEPIQAWYTLEALFAQRPDLRAPLPPPPPTPTGQPGSWSAPQPGYGGYAGYGPYAAPGYAYAPPNSDNGTVMAGLAHLSILFGAPWVALVLWLLNRGKLPFAADNARRAFFFQLVYFVIVLGGSGIFFVLYFTQIFPQFLTTTYTQPYPYNDFFSFYGYIFLFDGVLLVVQVIAIIFGVIAAVKAFQGKMYHYPLMGRI